MTKLIVGNWKMYPTLSDALVLSSILKKDLDSIKNVQVVLAPPISWLVNVVENWQKKTHHVSFAAQDIFAENQGAFTGEVSAYMLKDIIDYAIVGHSERRLYAHDTNQEIRKKIQACLDWKIKPIVCIGEMQQMIDADGKVKQGYHWTRVVEQLMESLIGVQADQLNQIIFAYEPIWAIGTKKAATPNYCQEVIFRLKDKIAEKYSRASSEGVKFLYGGSVDHQNAYDFLKKEDIEGLLVGGASVKARDFISICQIASKIG